MSRRSNSHQATGTHRRRFGVFFCGLLVIAAAVAARHYWPAETADAETPPRVATAPGRAAPNRSATPLATRSQTHPTVAAIVNGEEISRDILARECVRHFGKDVLETMMNRKLIQLHCQENDIVITNADISAEIERNAAAAKLSREMFLQLLQEERGVSPEQYARDLVWPKYAMRRLAADKLEVSEKDINKALETDYGPRIKARIIVLDEQHAADQVRRAALADPESFAKLATKHSIDRDTASNGGRIQAIRLHVGDPQIEQVAFNMNVGEISPIITVGNQFVVLKCEGQIPATRANRARIPQIKEQILAGKLRDAGQDLFHQLQKDAVVQNVMNNPELSKTMPGVAATINGRPITLKELREECLELHGERVLTGVINRMLLQQQIRKSDLKVTQEEIVQEVARAAVSADIIDKEGKADFKRWLEVITKQHDLTEQLYVDTIVWPSVALKKLVGQDVKVTEEELQKAFDSSYGPRVSCKAIFLGNHRRALEVWDKARRNPTSEFFGDLAAEYSNERGSRSLRGTIPPIRRYAGNPTLEKAAFALQPGEISTVVQVGQEQYVVLLCESYTKPIDVEMADVREFLLRGMHEKKLRVAMANHFEKILDKSRIVNHINPEASHEPKKAPQAARAS